MERARARPGWNPQLQASRDLVITRSARTRPLNREAMKLKSIGMCAGATPTEGHEVSASTGGVHPTRERTAALRQEAEDNGCPASPVPHLPRSPSECRPPNAPLLRRAVLPPHVVRSRVRTRGRAPHVAPVARQIPAVEYPLKMGDDDYGGDLMDQHAAARPQLPLFLPVCPSPGPAPSPSSDAA